MTRDFTETTFSHKNLSTAGLQQAQEGFLEAASEEVLESDGRPLAEVVTFPRYIGILSWCPRSGSFSDVAQFFCHLPKVQDQPLSLPQTLGCFLSWSASLVPFRGVRTHTHLLEHSGLLLPFPVTLSTHLSLHIPFSIRALNLSICKHLPPSLHVSDWYFSAVDD